MFGRWPLNQYGWPAASLTFALVPVGTSSESGGLPLAGMSTLWNAVGRNRTESPTWMVTVWGKKSIASASWAGARNRFWSLVGSPMYTFLTFACAASGEARHRAAIPA